MFNKEEFPDDIIYVLDTKINRTIVEKELGKSKLAMGTDGYIKIDETNKTWVTTFAF